MFHTNGKKPWAILPLKSISLSNSRLTPILTTYERRILSLTMMKDVVNVLNCAPSVGGLLVVTKCEIIKTHCQALGATVLEEDGLPQLNTAIMQAVQFLESRGIEKFFTVPGDVPLLNLSEIDILVQSLQMSEGLTLVPSQDGMGTNSIASKIPLPVQPRFGVNSLLEHHKIAKNKGVSVEILPLKGFSFDIDWPSDLVRLVSIGNSSRTQDYLSSLDLEYREHPILEDNFSQFEKIKGLV
tara:strand:+ start:2014 stop:2736 length:723 start_codon:yes stop_codon:yes gene_type:complete